MKQAKKNIFSLVNQLKEILENKPSQKQMFREVEMMHFKIKPLSGDISLLNFKNNQLVEALWGLGKLDEFFRTEFKNASNKEKELFFQMVSQLRGRLENQLRRINFHTSVKKDQLIEMEIFKEYPRRKN